MSARNLILIGSVWFVVAVVLEVRVGQTSFGVTVIGRSAASRAVALAGFYTLIAAYAALLLGWVVPFGLGLYRLVRRH